MRPASGSTTVQIANFSMNRAITATSPGSGPVFTKPNGFTEANTPQGNIGIKVWVNNGDYLTGEINDATDAQAGQVSKKSTRRRKG